MIVGILKSIYDDNVRKEDFKRITFIEYNNSIKLKVKYVYLYKDGRTKFINDSISFGGDVDYSFDGTFSLLDNLSKVDSLIKDKNNDTLKCILHNRKVVFIEVPNPNKYHW